MYIYEVTVTNLFENKQDLLQIAEMKVFLSLMSAL